MQIERATPVREVLPVEAREAKLVRVIDDSVRRVLQLVAGSAPSLAEIAVFGCRERKIFVEPADLHELIAGHREIVRREEPPWRRVIAVVLVEKVDDPLARRGV